MRGRQHTNIDLSGLGFSDSRDLLFLKDSKETGLNRGRDITNLVEEQGATMGRLKEALLVVKSAGKCPFLVSE